MFPSLWSFGRSLVRMLLTTIVTDLPMDFDTDPQLQAAYDFVVVGGGTSGSVVASRLAEVPSWRVLLLESGGSATPETAVPAFSLLAMDGDNKWDYRVAPQAHAQYNFKGHSSPYPLGKGMGGSSSINLMTHVRGNKRDYDNWAHLGNLGWDYHSVLPYFRKSEDFHGKVTNDNSEFHGFGGPLSVEAQSWSTPVQDALLDGGRELGYPVIDPNGYSQIGFSALDLTTHRGIRSSASESYLRPNIYRKNLDICTHAHVTKITFDDYNRAVGVRFLRKGEKEQEVFVSREVILSAGAVNTPQILLLSGIGGRHQLHKLGIFVNADVPGVGANLQDHPTVYGLTWKIKRGMGQNLINMVDPSVFADYRLHKRGVLTSPFGLEGKAWTSLGYTVDPAWPDLEFTVFSAHPALDNGFRIADMMGFERKFFGRYFSPLFGREGFTIAPMLTRPKSRGSVTLSSSDPTEPPIIDPNFLSSSEDVDSLIDGIKFSLLLGNTSSFRDALEAEFHDQALPGCEDLPYGGDAYWGCYVRHMTASSYHPAGTCKMAVAHDPMGVVSNRLKVRGVSSIRVADASVMPVLPSGGLHAACIMIGEKAADIIKEDWGVIF
uniref:Glucose dehydrogenase [FAD, quinone]-like n=2 Tax=Hirondellea gigas TaxID=1518452 RepID=A0A6A7FTD1_9CRUS